MDRILNIDTFLEQLAKQDASPDYLVFESALAQHFDKIGKINYSFLVAVWQLVRLGALPLPPLKKLTPFDKPFVAEKTITILPRIYERNEQKALDYIKLSPFADYLPMIEYVFF